MRRFDSTASVLPCIAWSLHPSMRHRTRPLHHRVCGRCSTRTPPCRPTGWTPHVSEHASQRCVCVCADRWDPRHQHALLSPPPAAGLPWHVSWLACTARKRGRRLQGGRADPRVTCLSTLASSGINAPCRGRTSPRLPAEAAATSCSVQEKNAVCKHVA